MGTEGRKQAETRFGLAEIASHLFGIYDDVLGVVTHDNATQTEEIKVKSEVTAQAIKK
jgi:hypothetical protein